MLSKNYSRNVKVSLVLALVLVLNLLAGCSSTSSAQKQETASKKQLVLKFGHVLPPTHPLQKSGEKFAELIATQNVGIKIELYPQEQLGNEKTLPQGLQQGTVGGIFISSGGFAAVNKAFSVIDAPYIWNSPAKLVEVLRGPIGDELKAKAQKENAIHILDFWYNGTRNLTTKNTVVTKPADVAKLKIRAPEIPIYIDTVKAMGGSPTPISMGELFTALQSGVVDGQENPLAQIWTSKLYEVQHQIALTGHMSQGIVVAIQQKNWEGLSSVQQKALTDAVRQAGDFMLQQMVSADKDLLTQLKDKGMNVTEVDRNVFRDAMKPVIEKYNQDWGGLYEKIRQAQ